VETEAQLEVLSRIGCTSGQGYLLAQPMPASEVIPFIERWTGDYVPRTPHQPAPSPLKAVAPHPAPPEAPPPPSQRQVLHTGWTPMI
jgi:hypothetical protein